MVISYLMFRFLSHFRSKDKSSKRISKCTEESGMIFMHRCVWNREMWGAKCLRKRPNSLCRLWYSKKRKGHRGWSNRVKKELYQSNLKRPIKDGIDEALDTDIFSSTAPSLLRWPFVPSFSVVSWLTAARLCLSVVGSSFSPILPSQTYRCVSQAITLIATNQCSRSLGTLVTSSFFFLILFNSRDGSWAYCIKSRTYSRTNFYDCPLPVMPFTVLCYRIPDLPI